MKKVMEGVVFPEEEGGLHVDLGTGLQALQNGAVGPKIPRIHLEVATHGPLILYVKVVLHTVVTKQFNK